SLSSGSSQSKLSNDELRAEVIALADNYCVVSAQGLDTVIRTSKRPELIDVARQTKIATATNVFTNAAGMNAMADLLDLIVFISLRRWTMEEHWMPMYGDELRPVLDAYKSGEAKAWETADRALTETQIQELKRLIDQWKKDNPDQYYVSHVRLAEFASMRRV